MNDVPPRDGAGNVLRSYVHGPGVDEVLIDYQDSPSWVRRFACGCPISAFV